MTQTRAEAGPKAEKWPKPEREQGPKGRTRRNRRSIWSQYPFFDRYVYLCVLISLLFWRGGRRGLSAGQTISDIVLDILLGYRRITQTKKQQTSKQQEEELKKQTENMLQKFFISWYYQFGQLDRKVLEGSRLIAAKFRSNPIPG